jgi:uncharacterized membrane protein YtjA (UPF0391 family)
MTGVERPYAVSAGISLLDRANSRATSSARRLHLLPGSDNWLGLRRIVAEFESLKPTFGKGRCIMLSWALTFLVIALIAAALGFGALSGTAMYIAQVLFFVFLVLFIISLIVPRVRPPVA